MTLAAKLALLHAGLYLLTGMGAGVLKYVYTMRSPEHRAPFYIDTAHRAALLYSFAALVIARLAEFSPYSAPVQVISVALPLLYFTLTIIQYLRLGLQNQTENQFSQRNFITTWFMYGLIAGEIGGVALLVWGFAVTQF